MRDAVVFWDLDDDEDGNVRHIELHGITREEIEDVLFAPEQTKTYSRSSGERISFGPTSTGRYIAVVWEHIQDDPLTIRPITAYEAPEPRRRKR